jgi:hypothetical protein
MPNGLGRIGNGIDPRSRRQKTFRCSIWSKERLMSAEARRNWIEPDLCRLK